MKLGLGTAQFGLDYGIFNRRGQCSSAEAAAILRLAAEGGIDVLDTAGAYGTSERVLGQTMSPDHRFRMVSKTPVLSHADVDPRHAVEAALMTTLERLGRDSIYGLLVHHADDLLSAAGAGLWQAMQAIKRRRLVCKIGVSVYDAAQLDQVLDRFDVELVQLPVNLFDQRLVYGGYLARLKARGIEVHARSVFLQGLLLMDPASVPESLAPVKQPLACLHDELRTAGVPAPGKQREWLHFRLFPCRGPTDTTRLQPARVLKYTNRIEQDF